MRLSIRHSSWLILCLLLLGPALASCTSFVGNNTSAPDNMTLKVAINAKGAASLPFYIAQQRNYFKAQGLTLTPDPVSLIPTSGQMTAAVESGSIDLCAAGVISDLVNLSRIQGTIKLIGAETTSYSADVIMSNNLVQQAGLSQASSLSDKLKALEGKKIGVVSFTGGTAALLIYLFKTVLSVDINKVAQLVAVGGTAAAAVAALKQGRVDALSFFPPTGQQVESLGIGQIMISPPRGDIPQIEGMVSGIFYATQHIIDTKPQSMKAFIRAMDTAEVFIQQNPNQAATYMKQYLNLDDKTTTAVTAMVGSSYSTNPLVTQQSFNTATDFYVKAGIIQIAPRYSALVNSDVVNQALQGFTPHP